MIETAEDWRVLVAEDDDLFAEAIDTFLSDAGFSVVVAGDGEAALREADADGFDALVTDLRMPRLDGAALIRRLRARRPDLPVIVMSGHAPENWQQSLQREGEGPLLLLGKPTKMGDLVRALQSVLTPRLRD
ncbi:MAG: response regulator [Proteobacteria bacterium]|nr:response regulator [Pseudomonadota bacterium]